MKKNIKIIPFPEIENAYIVISGNKSDRGNGCKHNLTFLYATNKIACEWKL